MIVVLHGQHESKAQAKQLETTSQITFKVTQSSMVGLSGLLLPHPEATSRPTFTACQTSTLTGLSDLGMILTIGNLPMLAALLIKLNVSHRVLRTVPGLRTHKAHRTLQHLEAKRLFHIHKVLVDHRILGTTKTFHSHKTCARHYPLMLMTICHLISADLHRSLLARPSKMCRPAPMDNPLWALWNPLSWPHQAATTVCR